MTRPEPGLPADEVLKLDGYAAKDTISPPRQLGEDDHGQIIAWFYPDCWLEMRHRGGCYRVAAVNEYVRE